MDQDQGERDAKRQTILVIDDEPVNALLIWQLVGEHEVISAENGTEGIAKALELTPDLILLDINMPDMQGFDVCTRLRADPRTRSVPIIFITTMDAVEDKVRGFAAGAVDYIVKPYSKEEVVARINTHLLLRKLQVKAEERNKKITTHMEVLEQLVYIIAETNDQVYEALSASPSSPEIYQDLKKMKDMAVGIISDIESELREDDTFDSEA